MKRHPTKAKTPTENALLRREIKRLRFGDKPITRSAICSLIESEHGLFVSQTKVRSIEFELQKTATTPIAQIIAPRLHFFCMLNQPTAVSGE